jgi:hypothetical protein
VQLKILEQGTYVREIKKATGIDDPLKECATGFREPSELSLGMNKIWTGFLVLLLGIVLCSAMYCVERIADGRRRDVFAGKNEDCDCKSMRYDVSSVDNT